MSRSQLESIRILQGPGVTAHRPAVEAAARMLAAESGLAVAVVLHDDEAALTAALATAGPGEALLVAPGTLADVTAVQGAAVAAARAATGLVWVDLRVAARPVPEPLAAAGVQVVRGRGSDGFRWALRSLVERAAWPWAEHRYGPHRDQVADLRLPAGDGPHPVAVLIHGGAWREQWERDLMDGMAVDLARRGLATWNLDYRRAGGAGGWPHTFDDVGAGIDALADARAAGAPLDLDRVVLVGHSAGGHLALFAATRAEARVPTAHVVSLAGLPDLTESANRGVYERAVEGLVGGLPDAVPDRYATACPAAQLPLGVPQLLVHGTADLPDNVDMNRTYAQQAAAAGDDVELLELPGVDHFAIIEPRSVPYLPIAQRIVAWAS